MTRKRTMMMMWRRRRMMTMMRWDPHMGGLPHTI
jgi:hypothetical protein